VAPKTEFLSPEFIHTLLEKCFSYVLATERWHDAQGKRVDPKKLVNDPIFRAVHYYRKIWLAQKVLQGDEGDPPSQWPTSKADPNQTQLLADTVLQAVGAGDSEALRHLADLVELNERAQAKCDFLRRPKGVGLPWNYYAGMAALSYLLNTTVPTKEDIKELAIRLRAQASLPAKSGMKALQEKMAGIRKTTPQWRHIFRDLGLASLSQR
jgi:hypothetical protein